MADSTSVASSTQATDDAWDSIALTLTENLKSSKPFCTRKLRRMAEQIDDALAACTSSAEPTQIAQSHPELLRGGMAFLAARDPDTFLIDEGSLANMVMRCGACDACLSAGWEMDGAHTDQEDHQVGSSELVDLSVIVHTICECLVLALSSLTSETFCPIASSPGPQPWPTSPLDLLPSGVDVTSRALNQWLTIFPSSSKRHNILRLAAALIRHHEPFAIALMDPEKRYPLAWSTPLLITQHAVENGAEGLDAQLRMVGEPIRAVIELLEALETRKKASLVTIIFQRIGAWRLALNSAQKILTDSPSSWTPVREKIAAYMMLTLGVTFDSGASSLRLPGAQHATGTFLDGVFFGRPPPAPGTWEWDSSFCKSVFKTLADARSGSCANLTCPASPESHAPLCSQCNILRFCDRKCLTDAWKMDVFPHKNLCKILGGIKAQIGPVDWARMWRPDFTHHDFSTLCREKSVSKLDLEAARLGILSIRAIQASYKDATKNESMSQSDLKSFTRRTRGEAMCAQFGYYMEVYERII